MNNLGRVIFIYLVIHISLFFYQENSKPKVFKIECERGQSRGENGECLPFYKPGDRPDV